MDIPIISTTKEAIYAPPSLPTAIATKITSVSRPTAMQEPTAENMGISRSIISQALYRISASMVLFSMGYILLLAFLDWEIIPFNFSSRLTSRRRPWAKLATWLLGCRFYDLTMHIATGINSFSIHNSFSFARFTGFTNHCLCTLQPYSLLYCKYTDPTKTNKYCMWPNVGYLISQRIIPQVVIIQSHPSPWPPSLSVICKW